MPLWFKEKIPTVQDHLDTLNKHREEITLRMLELQHELNLTDAKINHYNEQCVNIRMDKKEIPETTVASYQTNGLQTAR